MLLAQLEKDQEAVDQVREIVAAEEQVMKRETQIVEEYADVSYSCMARTVFKFLNFIRLTNER